MEASLIVGERDVEVVEPEVDQHRLELVLRVDRLQHLVRHELTDELALRVGSRARGRAAMMAARRSASFPLPGGSPGAGGTIAAIDQPGAHRVAAQHRVGREGPHDVARRHRPGVERSHLLLEPRVGDRRRRAAPRARLRDPSPPPDRRRPGGVRTRIDRAGAPRPVARSSPRPPTAVAWGSRRRWRPLAPRRRSRARATSATTTTTVRGERVMLSILVPSRRRVPKGGKTLCKRCKPLRAAAGRARRFRRSGSLNPTPRAPPRACRRGGPRCWPPRCRCDREPVRPPGPPAARPGRPSSRRTRRKRAPRSERAGSPRPSSGVTRA